MEAPSYGHSSQVRELELELTWGLEIWPELLAIYRFNSAFPVREDTLSEGSGF